MNYMRRSNEKNIIPWGDARHVIVDKIKALLWMASQAGEPAVYRIAYSLHFENVF